MSMGQKASLAKAGKQWVKYKESADKAIAEGNYDLSESVLFAALTEAQDNFESTDFRYIYTLEKLAQSLWFLGRFDESVEYLEKLVDIHNQNSDKLEAIDNLTYSINLALAHHAARQNERAEAAYSNAINKCVQVFGDNHNCTVKIRSLLADLYQTMGYPDRANALNVLPTAMTSNDWLIVDTLKAIQTSLNPIHQTTGVSLPPTSNAGQSDRSFMPPPPPPMSTKQSQEPAPVVEEPAPAVQEQEPAPLPELSESSIPTYSEADEVAVPLRKSEVETIYHSNVQTAEVNIEKGDVEIAHYLFSINLKLLRYFDFDTILNIEALQNLIKVKQKMGLVDQAIDFAGELHELKKKQYGFDSIEASHSANELAGIYYGAAMYDSAIELTKECIGIYKKHHGEEHATIASSLHNLATLYHVQRQYSQAEDIYKQCLDMKNKVFGAQHPSTSRLLKSYAELLRETHREAEAEHMGQMAVGMITGSWKPVETEEEKPKEPEVERCEVCNADMEGQDLCPVCAFKKRKRGITAFTDL